MNLIHRHLLVSFARNLAYTIVGALILFTLIDMLDHMNSFLDNNATSSMVGRYYLYRAVWIIVVTTPCTASRSTRIARFSNACRRSVRNPSSIAVSVNSSPSSG